MPFGVMTFELFLDLPLSAKIAWSLNISFLEHISETHGRITFSACTFIPQGVVLTFNPLLYLHLPAKIAE